MKTIEQWEAEAMRLADEYGRLKSEEGLADGAFDALGRRRFREEAQEALAALSAHLATHPGRQGEWLPIESAPKDGTQVLLGRAADQDEDGEPREGVVAQGYWLEGYGDEPDQMGHDSCWTDCNFDVFTYPRSFGAEAYRSKGFQPTHWMPLPKEPTHE